MLSVPNLFYINLEPSVILKSRQKYGVIEGDHLTYLSIFKSWKNCKTSKSAFCREIHLNENSIKQVDEILNNLKLYLKKFNYNQKSTIDEDGEDILKCLLKGYFLNVAQKQIDGSYRSLKNSNILHIHPTSVLYTILPEYVFYTDIILSAKNFMLNVSKIEKDWILEVGSVCFFDKTKNLIKNKHEMEVKNQIKKNENKKEENFKEAKNFGKFSSKNLMEKEKEKEKEKDKNNLNPNLNEFKNEEKIFKNNFEGEIEEDGNSLKIKPGKILPNLLVNKNEKNEKEKNFEKKNFEENFDFDEFFKKENKNDNDNRLKNNLDSNLNLNLNLKEIEEEEILNKNKNTKNILLKNENEENEKNLDYKIDEDHKDIVKVKVKDDVKEKKVLVNDLVDDKDKDKNKNSELNLKNDNEDEEERIAMLRRKRNKKPVNNMVIKK